MAHIFTWRLTADTFNGPPRLHSPNSFPESTGALAAQRALFFQPSERFVLDLAGAI